MKKITILILTLSLNSCTLFYKHLPKKENCDGAYEPRVGYHVHCGTYNDSEGREIMWAIEVNNNDECNHCSKKNKK